MTIFSHDSTQDSYTPGWPCSIMACVAANFVQVRERQGTSSERDNPDHPESISSQRTHQVLRRPLHTEGDMGRQTAVWNQSTTDSWSPASTDGNDEEPRPHSNMEPVVFSKFCKPVFYHTSYFEWKWHKHFLSNCTGPIIHNYYYVSIRIIHNYNVFGLVVFCWWLWWFFLCV